MSSTDPTITIPLLESSASDRVVALRDTTSGKSHSIPRERGCLTIGSGPAADVRLEDSYVSALHCTIERPSRRRLIVSDMRSKNGVYLDGHRVTRADLRPGSKLRIGRSTLVVLSERACSGNRAADQLVGEATSFREAIELANRVARSGDCSVLILGETGTGKELVARMIHESSQRAGGPFVTLNCGGLTSTLIGSELFGHVRGAFTGARDDRDGVFVQADTGTLFLDEIGELPLDQQPHLLRALESGDVRPLGSTETSRVDVRFIAATNRLDVRMRERMRTDLYHRLATIVIRLPPLRERPHDIPLLIREFIRREGGQGRHVSVETMRALRAYRWSGNVRELRHSVKRALTLSSGELTLASFLPEYDEELDAAIQSVDSSDLSHYEDSLRLVLQTALAEYGTMRRAARALGVPKSTFADRARRLGVKRPRREKLALVSDSE